MTQASRPRLSNQNTKQGADERTQRHKLQLDFAQLWNPTENDKKKYEGKFLAFKRVGVLLSLIIILQAEMIETKSQILAKEFMFQV